MTEFKICGLTRAIDTEVAVGLGASYVGVIFAGGPRRLSVDRAREVLLPARGSSARRVGVFGAQDVEEILRTVHDVPLDIVQLHGGDPYGAMLALCARGWTENWPVLGLSPDATAGAAVAKLWIAAGAAAVVLDAAVGAQRGGTGRSLRWEALASEVRELRASGRVVLAGGLHAENVGGAIAQLSPDIVDVSSGVESSPGHKDHNRMHAFAAAVRGEDVQ